MDASKKIYLMRTQIEHQLSPLIKGKVALFGLPCHGNIGDVYIAMGELLFLESIGANVVYKKMFIDSTPLPDLPQDCTILLQGGGDFGDVWRGIQECRLKVLEKYRNHRIVIFPQSVYYSEKSNLTYDATLLSRCVNLTICARDGYSFELLKTYFENNVILVPDMAFFIPPSLLTKHSQIATKESLFLKRLDKERCAESEFQSDWKSDSIMTVSDWPTINNDLWCLKLNIRLVGITDAFLLRKMFTIAAFVRKLTIWEMIYIAYPMVAKIGVHFLSDFRHLYLTRLHSAILALLLDKKFVLLDNSYHKNRNFFETWLQDVDQAEFQKNEKS